MGIIMFIIAAALYCSTSRRNLAHPGSLVVLDDAFRYRHINVARVSNGIPNLPRASALRPVASSGQTSSSTEAASRVALPPKPSYPEM
jgi:hypothetical protein